MTQEKYVCTLSKELQEVAMNELNEDPEKRDKDIQALRERVIANKALKCPRDNAFLLRFLRAKKFDQQKAYDQLISYYTVRAQNSQHLINLTPLNSKLSIESGFLTVLPTLDKLGRRIVYCRLGRWNPEEMEMMKLLRVNLLTLEQMIRTESNQVKGIVSLVNCIDVGMIHLTHFDLGYMRFMNTFMQNAFPMRHKATHVINEPSVIGYINSLVKPLMSKKFTERQHFHGSSLESLQEHFDVSSLPEELGGSLGPGDLLADAWKKELYSNEEYFKDMLKYNISLETDIFNGKKTLETPTAPSVTGTFKKLQID